MNQARLVSSPTNKLSHNKTKPQHSPSSSPMPNSNNLIIVNQNNTNPSSSFLPPTWSITGKRGRKRKPPTNTTSQDHETAYFLLLLSCSTTTNSVSTMTTQSSDQSTDKDHWPAFHRCANCGKSFASHQALGGHRASHRRIKGCFASAAVSRDEKEEEEEEKEEGEVVEMEMEMVLPRFDFSTLNKNNKKSFKKRVHQCSLCLKFFPSGQALGGHKRCHWERGKGRCSTGNRKNLGSLPFDLNQPPPEYHFSNMDEEAPPSSPLYS